MKGTLKNMTYTDLHVHIDFFSDPIKVAKEYEKRCIYAIFVTYLPEIFEKSFSDFTEFKYVRVALGFHPDMVGEYEFNENLFEKYLKKTRYIGEVGLEFSGNNSIFQQRQIEIFKLITKKEYNKGNIYSIHSRGAEKEVLSILKDNNVKCAIFHWYTGNLTNLKEISKAGYYFSVNYKMLMSKRGRRIIEEIPKDKILFETDAPFARKERRIVYPKDIGDIYFEFENIFPGFTDLTFNNFKRLLFEKDIDKI